MGNRTSSKQADNQEIAASGDADKFNLLKKDIADILVSDEKDLWKPYSDTMKAIKIEYEKNGGVINENLIELSFKFCGLDSNKFKDLQSYQFMPNIEKAISDLKETHIYAKRSLERKKQFAEIIEMIRKFNEKDQNRCEDDIVRINALITESEAWVTLICDKEKTD